LPEYVNKLKEGDKKKELEERRNQQKEFGRKTLEKVKERQKRQS